MMKNNQARIEIIDIVTRKPNFFIRWGITIFTLIAIVASIVFYYFHGFTGL